jgi:regulation of enolase protein 1 (concanavalin A-like superfamily)
MTRTRKQFAAFTSCILLLSLADGASQPPLAAQTSSMPAFSVVRTSAFGQDVWPGDFDGDGKTDLAASNGRLTFPTPSAKVEIALGKGDGTFAAPIVSSFVGGVLAVGDMNNDGRLDVIAGSSANGVTLAVLPGNGNGTLGAARIVSMNRGFHFVLVADFDDDGNRDIAIASDDTTGSWIFPGRGDFTFGAPAPFTTGLLPNDGIVADFNGDSRRDMAIANRYSNSVSIFVNQGALMFTASDIPLDRTPTDATAADVNRDGRIDLIVSVTVPQDVGYFREGFAYVLMGHGDGTFDQPIEYAVAPGPFQVVVGDFTRDGITDIATADRSPITRDDCGPFYRTWDSISILAGRGDGTFGAATSFSMGDQRDVDGFEYRYSVSKLNTSDLNGDHVLDLIASGAYGSALFLTRPFVANRPPVVDLGPDRVLLNTSEVALQARVSDPDEDVVTYRWSSSTDDVSLGPYPNPCITGLGLGPHTFTATVDDGHGHQASDSVTLTRIDFEDGHGNFSESHDVGSPAPPGTDSFDGTTYTVTAGGTDIWGTADAFHYVWTGYFSANSSITVRVASVQDVNQWTKAGLMVRENLNAGARHASLFATPGKGLSFQRRAVENGTSTSTPGPALTAPVWLRLSRVGDTISAYYRQNPTDLWTKIGQQTLTGLVPDALVGLAVTSHSQGTPATATFTDLDLRGELSWTGMPIGAGSGSLTSWDGTVVSVAGRGADIWGTKDAFFFTRAVLSGNHTMSTRVRSIANTHVWAKAGVMFRETAAPDSRHVMVVVTPGSGVSFQYRLSTGDISRSITVAGTAPEYVRLARNGNTFTGSASEDGVTWRTIGSVTFPMTFDYLVGLAVSSHNAAATTTAMFEDVVVTF